MATMAGPSNLVSGHRGRLSESLEGTADTYRVGPVSVRSLANIQQPHWMVAYRLILPTIHKERRYGGTFP